MRRPIELLTLCLVLTSVGGCAGVIGKVRTRAAFDFECAEDAVEVKAIGAGGFHASGCDQEATYVCTSGEYMTTCIQEAEARDKNM